MGRSLLQQSRMRKRWPKMPKIKRDQSIIYFIGAAIGEVKYVKIGFTAVCPRKRMIALQLGSPVELVLLGSFLGIQQDEIDLHRRFQHLHSHREWFVLDSELESEIGHLCSKQEES